MRISVFALFAIAGCSYVVPETLRALAEFDPLVADPGAMAVDFELPEGLGILPETAMLNLHARHLVSGEVVDAGIRLIGSPGDIWRIDPRDLELMRVSQARVRGWEEEDPEASEGSLSITLDPCAVGEGPAEGAVVSAGLQTRSDGPFLPLISGLPVSEITEYGANGQLPDCP